MIGGLQRNKARAAVGLFSCVQSVDRLEVIDALAKAATGAAPLPILLELNAGEESKSGFKGIDSIDGLCAGAERALGCSGLVIRGLMTMAPWTNDAARVRAAFRNLVKARGMLEARFPSADFGCLSMGMSGDYTIAIEEGSTLVRIGTAIFGERV
jgi:pyridoxal phosphate enzyme (YggS family)